MPIPTGLSSLAGREYGRPQDKNSISTPNSPLVEGTEVAVRESVERWTEVFGSPLPGPEPPPFICRDETRP